MARKFGKNPIDPDTGKPRRGRPRKVRPVDTLGGPQPREAALTGGDIPDDDQDAIVVRHLDPLEDVSTELAQLWKRRFKGTEVMTVPDEVQGKYPDGMFCWARDSKECISKYRTQFGYEPVSTESALPGQTDTAFRFGDAILMVRPKWMKKIHDQARREAVQAQTQSKSQEEADAEREARAEARRAGYDGAQRDISFETEEAPDEEAYEHDHQLRVRLAKEVYASEVNRPSGAKGRGSKYWAGGLSK